MLAVLGARARYTPSSQLLTILGLNPGVAFDRTQWTYTGYKGGSEPGVTNLSWLLLHESGEWFSVVVTLNDPNRTIDTTPVVQAATSLVRLLAVEASR